MHFEHRAIVHRSDGFTLIELVVFIVIISIGLMGVLSVYQNTTSKTVDPLIQLRALELAQAQLDEILSRKYDTNTPTGGLPACSLSTTPCDAFNGADASNCDDVDDFSDPGCALVPSYPGYSIAVTVQAAGPGAGSGADLAGLAGADAAKLITVNITTPDGVQMHFSTYRSNF